MKLKCKKSWLPNGDVVLEVRDHDVPLVRAVNASGERDRYGRYWNKGTKSLPVLERLVFPRGTPKEDVANARKALILTCELRLTPL